MAEHIIVDAATFSVNDFTLYPYSRVKVPLNDAEFYLSEVRRNYSFEKLKHSLTQQQLTDVIAHNYKVAQKLMADALKKHGVPYTESDKLDNHLKLSLPFFAFIDDDYPQQTCLDILNVEEVANYMQYYQIVLRAMNRLVEHYNKNPDGSILKDVWDDACGLFHNLKALAVNSAFHMSVTARQLLAATNLIQPSPLKVSLVPGLTVAMHSDESTKYTDSYHVIRHTEKVAYINGYRRWDGVVMRQVRVQIDATGTTVKTNAWDPMQLQLVQPRTYVLHSMRRGLFPHLNFLKGGWATHNQEPLAG
jgi:hypothetical protein